MNLRFSSKNIITQFTKVLAVPKMNSYRYIQMPRDNVHANIRFGAVPNDIRMHRLVKFYALKERVVAPASPLKKSVVPAWNT